MCLDLKYYMNGILIDYKKHADVCSKNYKSKSRAIVTRQLITGVVEKFKIRSIKYKKYKTSSKYRDLIYTDTCWSVPNLQRCKLFECRLYLVDIIIVLVLLESDDMIIPNHMT